MNLNKFLDRFITFLDVNLLETMIGKKKKKYESTEGEDIIKDYLESENISFVEQKEVSELKGDIFNKRIADFYLPRYKVYIEFLGQWASEKGKERYKLKKEVYRKNNIPCVYIYPENLGVLKYILIRRIKRVLQDDKRLKWQLFKLNYDLFNKEFGLEVIILAILFYYLDSLILRSIISVLFVFKIYDSLKKSFFKRINK